MQQYIEENRANVNDLNIKDANDETALMLAANNNHIPVTLALLAVPGIEVEMRCLHPGYMLRSPPISDAYNASRLHISYHTE